MTRDITVRESGPSMWADDHFDIGETVWLAEAVEDGQRYAAWARTPNGARAALRRILASHTEPEWETNSWLQHVERDECIPVLQPDLFCVADGKPVAATYIDPVDVTMDDAVRDNFVMLPDP